MLLFQTCDCNNFRNLLTNLIFHIIFPDDIEMEKRERKFVHTRKRKNEKQATNGEQTRLVTYAIHITS